MVVIEANLPHIVKLLLGYKRIKLDVKNKQGDSLMHLCIDSRETVSLFIQSVCCDTTLSAVLNFLMPNILLLSRSPNNNNSSRYPMGSHSSLRLLTANALSGFLTAFVFFILYLSLLQNSYCD